MKCDYCGHERDFPFLEVLEVTMGKHMRRKFCNYLCLDRFMHNKLGVKSEVVKLHG